MFSSTTIDCIASTPATTSLIFESKQITDIKQHCEEGTVGAFDLDNTVFRPKNWLGSATWFREFLTFTQAKIRDENEAKEITITIHRAVQYVIDVEIVDPALKNMLETFIQTGLLYVALTARGDDIADITFEQLRKVGIDFSQQWNKDAFYFDVDEGKHRAYYKDGVIFCAGYDKGKCLLAFFTALGLTPRKVVMTDDEEKNLVHVKEAVEKIGVSFAGLRYAYLDDMIAQFDMEQANHQLIEMRCKLTNEAKMAVDRIHTTSTQHHTRTCLWTLQTFSNKPISEKENAAIPLADRLEMIFNSRSGL